MYRLSALALLPLSLASAACAQSVAPATPTGPAAPASAPAPAFQSDRITVEVVGDGPDVVLIPGLSSSPTAWRSTVAAVPGYRYHLIQVKGFAGVAPEGNATGPVLLPVAEEIARYIAERGLHQPALVGHSMGGSLAMAVATRHPDAVGRLMVVDMLPFLGVMFGGPSATPQSVEPVAQQVRQGMAGTPPEAYRTQATQAVSAMVRNDTLRPLAVADSIASDQAVSAQAMYDLITTSFSADLDKFKGPFRVLWVVPAGAPISQEMLAMGYRAAYAPAPQATVEYIPDSAHFIMWDAPDRFQSELRTFLTQ